MNRKPVTVTVALLALVAPAVAFAGSATDAIEVSTTVTETCTIDAGALVFPGYDPVSGAAVEGSATVMVACTQGSSNTITLDDGQNEAAESTEAAPLRQMANGPERLSYALFTDASRSVEWGNTEATGVTYEAASSSPTGIVVYGRVAGGQAAVAGLYQDSVLATVSF